MVVGRPTPEASEKRKVTHEMTAVRLRRLSRFAVAAVVGACGACGGDITSAGAPGATDVAVEVQPRSATLAPEQTLQLNATVTGSAVTTVTWSVTCGSITQAGLFTAPLADAVCSVQARSDADTGKVGASTVTVTSSPSGPPASGWGARCAEEPFPATGTRYYVCDCASGADADCVAGADSNNGTSPSTPKRSWDTVKSLWRSLPAGGTVGLCKGGKWAVNDSAWTGAWLNTACTPGSPCTLRDYTPPWASGNEDRPHLSASGNVAPISLTSDTASDGYRFLNLLLRNTTSTGAGTGFGAWGNVNDIEVCNTVIDSFSFGAYLMHNGAGSSGQRQHFRGNRFLNNCTDAALVQTRDSDWDGNYFDNNGHAACGSYNLYDTSGGTTHTWYFDGDSAAVGPVRFINNEIHRSSVHPNQQLCVGNAVAILTGDTANVGGVLVENNYFDTPKFANCSTQFFAGGSWGVTNHNVVVRNNYIEVHEGNAIAFSQAPNALVENNVIVSTGTGAGWWDNEALISVPHKTDGPATSGGTVRNNTIYIAGTTGNRDGRVAISVAKASTATGYNVTGNAIYVAPGGAIQGCFRVGDASRLAFMDNNVCSGPATWVQHEANGTSYGLAAWRTFSGRDASSSATAPTWVGGALPGLDLTPAAGSSLVGAGSTATTCTVRGVVGSPCSAPTAVESSTWSATRTSVARDAAPDVGALER